MNIYDKKELKSNELTIDMEIVSYKNIETKEIHMIHLIVSEIGEDFVSLNYTDGNHYVTLTNLDQYIFERNLTEEEFENKYHSDVEDIVEALNNKLAQVDGCHEMYNSWLYAGSLSKIASKLREDNMKIIGYATLTVPKTTFFGEVLDIGVVAEYEDGDRIWCHASDKYRLDLLERYFRNRKV